MRSQSLLQRMQDASFTADCGFCSVTFGSNHENPSYARLAIRSIAASPSEHNCQQLQDALARVLDTQIEFTAVYDFREYKIPAMHFARSFCAFVDSRTGEWVRYLKVIAMLVKDNLWASVAKGFIATLCKMCPPCCPYIICHSGDAAEQFISNILEQNPFSGGLRRATESRTSMSSFVSIEDLMASKLSRPASMTLLQDVGSSVRLCELSNGDLQVVQSRGSSDRLNDYNFVSSMAGSSSKLLGSQSFQSISSFESMASMSSFPHSCSREALQQLGAAHFHLDELMLDAKEEQSSPLFFFNRAVMQVFLRLQKFCNVLTCGCTSG